MGYAIGAILTGVIADTLGINASVLVIGLVTIFSAAIIFYRMKCSNKEFVKIIDWIKTTFASARKEKLKEHKSARQIMIT
jgi:hypothetical protein